MKFTKLLFLSALLASLLSGCSSMPPLQTVDEVDLERFMGDWYVIANIPTPLEKGAHNAVETYRLDSNGTVATTFTFRDGGFDGKRKTYHPRGFPSEDNPAVWGMQFVWPIKADYRIIWLDDEYAVTVIGRNKRDYVWIMAREPQIGEDQMDRIFAFLDEVGYETDAVQRVPQQW